MFRSVEAFVRPQYFYKIGFDALLMLLDYFRPILEILTKFSRIFDAENEIGKYKN